MTSPIDIKRKELEDKIKNLEELLSIRYLATKENKIKYENLSNELKLCKCALLNLNLGVSLAQKEIFTWLDSQMNLYYKNKIVLTKEDLKELKESLGVK